MATFEEKYQAVLTYLRDNRPHLGQVDKVDAYLAETNAALDAAELDPQHRLELITLRNQAMTAAKSARDLAQRDAAIEDSIAIIRGMPGPSPAAVRRPSRSTTTDYYTPTTEHDPQRDSGISR